MTGDALIRGHASPPPPPVVHVIPVPLRPSDLVVEGGTAWEGEATWLDPSYARVVAFRASAWWDGRNRPLWTAIRLEVGNWWCWSPELRPVDAFLWGKESSTLRIDLPSPGGRGVSPGERLRVVVAVFDPAPRLSALGTELYLREG